VSTISAEPTRREAIAALGAGVFFVFTAPAPAQAQTQTKDALSTRLHINNLNVVTLLTGKVELGQGVRTLLIRATAEELHLVPEGVVVVMGDTLLVPDDGGTWASLTTPQTVPAVRRAAAALREVLLDTAAAKEGLARATKLQGEIWDKAVAASRIASPQLDEWGVIGAATSSRRPAGH
jgi:isoquinoline 1-oxidoreductase